MNAAPIGDDTLREKTVLVVGASSGIGRAVARTANERGARVVLSSRSASKLEEVRAGLARPEEAEVVPFDYRDREAVRDALGGLERLDHLVVPAVADENKKRGRFVELPDEVMRSSFDKFWGQLYVAQAAAPRMPPGGSISLFSSIAAFRPPGAGSGLSVMNAVHAAVATLGRSLALELAPVRVNVVVPGVVLSGVWTQKEREDLKVWAESSLPSRHVGTPEDLAHAVLHLMTNPYATGTLHFVDGGLWLT
jgi:NAD(P)-dependent dehydrogenase (short-subunit alcohol dehydrogenase family)